MQAEPSVAMHAWYRISEREAAGRLGGRDGGGRAARLAGPRVRVYVRVVCQGVAMVVRTRAAVRVCALGAGQCSMPSQTETR